MGWKKAAFTVVFVCAIGIEINLRQPQPCQGYLLDFSPCLKGFNAKEPHANPAHTGVRKVVPGSFAGCFNIALLSGLSTPLPFQ
jgi:hypothetical protein